MSSAIFVHVGPHKTGSTAIQKALRKRRARLLENGLLFPEAGMAGMGHHDLVNFLRGRPNDFDPADFRSEVGGRPLTLISSENFVMLDAGQLGRLGDLTSGKTVRIVYYLRRLVDLWFSHWQAMVRHGSPATFAEYVALASMTMTGRNTVGVIDQFGQLETLARVFGRDAISIVGYDVLRERKVNFAADLVRRVSPTAADAVELEIGESNVSIPLWNVELLRALNQIHQEATGLRASSALRRAVARDLADGRIGFAEEFAALVERRGSQRSFRERELVLKLLQDRVLDAYGDLIEGDRDETIEAYARATGRSMTLFRFPIAGPGAEEARRKLLDYYRALPAEALAREPPRLKRHRKDGGGAEGSSAEGLATA